MSMSIARFVLLDKSPAPVGAGFRMAGTGLGLFYLPVVDAFVLFIAWPFSVRGDKFLISVRGSICQRRS